jgi:hypothetical protein
VCQADFDTVGAFIGAFVGGWLAIVRYARHIDSS